MELPRRLQEVLDEGGIDVAGWVFFQVKDVTPDGRVFIGTGAYKGVTESWYAELGEPCRADWNNDGDVTSADFLEFLGDFLCHEQPCRSADFDDDGIVDSRDFFAFVVAFFAGCD